MLTIQITNMTLWHWNECIMVHSKYVRNTTSYFPTIFLLAKLVSFFYRSTQTVSRLHLIQLKINALRIAMLFDHSAFALSLTARVLERVMFLLLIRVRYSGFQDCYILICSLLPIKHFWVFLLRVHQRDKAENKPISLGTCVLSHFVIIIALCNTCRTL